MSTSNTSVARRVSNPLQLHRLVFACQKTTENGHTLIMEEDLTFYRNLHVNRRWSGDYSIYY